jgi:hypothetical protein
VRGGLGALALVALSGCGVETVALTMELRYDAAACGGCSVTAATLPAGSGLHLAISDAETDEVLVPRCFQSNAAVTIAELPALLSNSELTDFAVPGDRLLVARLDAYPPATGCDDQSVTPLLTATSAPTAPRESSRFLLVVECPSGTLCAAATPGVSSPDGPI